MKVGNVIGGLEVTDVKRVNKLNLIQFLKEVDNYLQQGYRIDVNSARQVGLVLMADVYKVEQPFGYGVGSVGEQTHTESVISKEAESAPEETVDTESTKSQEQAIIETSVEPVEDTVKEEAPKKTTTRSKKTAQ